MRSISLILVLLLVASCSSRVVHEPPANVVAIEDAININTATVEQLEKLPAIGLKTAENIVQFRDRYGPFRRVDHLLQIRGISERRLAEIRPYIKTE